MKMESEIVEVQGRNEELNYCVRIDGKANALFRDLEDANLYLKILNRGTSERETKLRLRRLIVRLLGRGLRQ
jgi:hypothetical protein